MRKLEACGDAVTGRIVVVPKPEIYEYSVCASPEVVASYLDIDELRNSLPKVKNFPHKILHEQTAYL